MSGSLQQRSPKQLIAANLLYLMKIYHKTRKEVCKDLDISYTTYCDWVNAKTYPRLENLDTLGYYFRIENRDFFIDLAKDATMSLRLKTYAEKLGVNYGVHEEPVGGPFSVEDYNETPEGYPVELINGTFFVCDSPTARHQRIQAELTIAIGMYIKKKKGKCKLFPAPFSVELPTKLPTVCVPDITVICNPNIINEKRCVGAPDWIIEILSKSTKERDLKDKLSVYEESGVKEYWLVDQYEDMVYVYKLEVLNGRNVYGPSKSYTFAEKVPVGIYGDFSLCFCEMDLD